MYTHLEDYIYDLYHLIGITEPGQIDVSAIAAQLNINIEYGSTTFRFSNNIILKKSTTENEWMEFGHELCHVLLHSGSQLNMYPLYIDYQECKAENFMYHFCVPTFMLERIRLPNTRKESISLIVNEFNVSYDFAEKRLDKWLMKKDGIKLHRFFVSSLNRDSNISLHY